MAGSLQRRSDGSVALFINGDLQFDSTDESIYHEALALPALALAEKRKNGELSALIIGGGDGLIARELFKSRRIRRVDLVDYDAEVLALAQSEFSHVNECSLQDARLTIHVQDAWDFTRESAAPGQYDLIVSDLTVPENASGARFHSVDWYDGLRQMLTSSGLLAINAVSALATPRAYWSVFNAVLRAGLYPRAYHVQIPSFSALGYGDDWGFLLASCSPIEPEELESELPLAEPRKWLESTEALRKLFFFPQEIFHYQKTARPGAAGSDVLLRYFGETEGDALSGILQDALAFSPSANDVPAADPGNSILSPELSAALGRYLGNADRRNAESADSALLVDEVLNLVAPDGNEKACAVAKEFLDQPAEFLASIDLRDLIARLLKRAAELPKALVAELEALRDALHEFTQDYEAMLSLGGRVITVLSLIIVIGNLLYPDLVYAKGGHADRAAHAGHAGGEHRYADERHDGVHRAGWWNGGGGGYTWRYWNGNNWVYDNTRRRSAKPSPNLEIINTPVRKRGPHASLDKADRISYCFDAAGLKYPSRLYNILKEDPEADQVSGDLPARAARLASLFRLDTGVDVIESGQIAMPLTEQFYMLVDGGGSQIVDQRDGRSAISLKTDPALYAFLSEEIARQAAALADALPVREKVSKQTYETACAALRLSTGRFAESSASIEEQGEESGSSKLGVSKLLPGVWLADDHRSIAVQLSNGETAFLDGKNWYSDKLKNTVMPDSYPSRLRQALSSFLAMQLKSNRSTQARLCWHRGELEEQISVLQDELQEFCTSSSQQVIFGTHEVDRFEAIRMTEKKISQMRHELSQLNSRIDTLPSRDHSAEVALALLDSKRNV